MHLKAFLISLSLVSYAASMGCELNSVRLDCVWEGTAPSCNAENLATSTTRGDGRILVRSTADRSVQSLFDNGYLSEDCYNAYGATCWSGHKSLWCRDPTAE
ncbi:hypothetical protein BDV40DRAFT_266422 [Aspergillus tamarii]|uniref:Cyanovirin-N domain-containing protein n=1 Tax=Aspergillus tamarii TaxID=41984 RepID=A0A5N6UU61_ASPTM|nr:hypothetical protein BDV40DRAFT_266422 [Aspergillus tamarii]